MKLSNVISFLFGSTTIYLSLAMTHACGSSDTLSGASSGMAGYGSAGGKSGAGGANSTGAVMNPVPDANANESGTRLRAKYYVGADGSKQWLGWYDSQRKEDCYFYQAGDGALRCVPLPMTYTEAYSDAACTKPIAIIYAPCASDGISPKHVLRYTGMGCKPTTGYTVYAVSKLTGGSEAYQKSTTGACVKTPVPIGFVLAELSPEIPPSEFVAADITIE